MNAEKFHAIIAALNYEIDNQKTLTLMAQLIAKLQEFVQAPTTSAVQHSFVQALQDLYNALSGVPSDNFSPTWRQIVSEIGGDNYFGSPLLDIIKNIIDGNQMTPAVGLDKLKQLHEKVDTYYEAISMSASSFQVFKIGDEKLSQGECEIGIQMPRMVVNNLDELANELREIDFLVRTFSEVSGENYSSAPIKSVSSSDLLVLINSYAPTAAVIAVAIQGIILTYKQLLEIRKLRIELKNQGVPEKGLAGVEAHANDVMEVGITELAKKIIQEHYKGKDAGRKNELENAVRISLGKIAAKIDRGFNMEVRAEPIMHPSEEEATQELQRAIQIIQEASNDMKFLKLDGEPILRLPEKTSESVENPPTTKQKKRKG